MSAPAEELPFEPPGETVREEEAWIAGAWLLDAAATSEKTAGLELEAFDDRRLRKVVRAASRLHDQGKDGGLYAVRQELERTGDLEDVGGGAFLAELLGAVPTTAEVELYAATLREEQRRRELARFGELVRTAAGGKDLAAAMGGLEERWAELRNGAGPSGADPLTMAEILEDPEMLRPPRALAPRFAWEARVTLLAGREKRGKSTIAAQAAAGVTRGRDLLGEPCREGTVLWIALEEHLTDLFVKLQAFDADPTRVYVLDRLASPLADLRAAVDVVGPVLVVVDTLPAFAALLDDRPESGSSADWTVVMSGLTRIARDSGAGLLLLHHADKVRERYRDSTAIGAGVDVILEMKSDRDHPGVRKVETAARWKVPPFSYRLEGDPTDRHSNPRLVLVEGGPTIREQIIAHVHDQPGCSTRDVRSAVSGRTAAVQGAIQELLREGVIVDLGDAHTGRRLHPPQDPHGTAPEPGGNHLGTTSAGGPVPEGSPPPIGRGTPEPPPWSAEPEAES